MGVRNVRWSRRRLVRAAAVASGLAVVCGEDDEVEQQQLPARAPGTRGAGSESPLASIRPNKLPPVVVVVGSVDRRLGWAVPRMVVVVGELGVMQRRGVRYVLAARGRYKGRSGTCSAASIPRVALCRLGGMKGLLFFPSRLFVSTRSSGSRHCVACWEGAPQPPLRPHSSRLPNWDQYGAKLVLRTLRSSSVSSSRDATPPHLC